MGDGNKIKILSLSDSYNVPTGYGRVMRELIQRINKDKFEFFHFGKQNLGMPGWVGTPLNSFYKSAEQLHDEARTSFDLNDKASFARWFRKEFCRNLPMGGSSDGGDVWQQNFDLVKPDITFTLLDMWMYNFILEKDLSPSKWVMYFPLDGVPVPQGCHKHLLKADVPIAMTEFGKKTAEEYEYFEQAENKYYTLGNRLSKPIQCIYHGVDTNTYYPLSKKEREELRAKEGTSDKFVIGMVSRNQPRKMLPIMFKMFAKFSKKNRNSLMHLHCDPHDQQGFDLINLGVQYKIQDKIRYTKMPSYKWGLTDEQMNSIYNLFDVHSVSSTGEGFGLTIPESMAAGIPNVWPDYTTPKELIADSGIAVPLSTLVMGSMNVDRGMVDLVKYEEALQYLYDNPGERERMGKRARELAVERYDWDKVIVPKWEALFEKVVSE